MVPQPINLPSQRGAFTWGVTPMPPAPNAWGKDSSLLLSLKNGGGSGTLSNMNDRPSSRGSSGPSTDGSDFLDSPISWGRNSHQVSASDVLPSNNSRTVISRLQSKDSRSGSLQFSDFQTSFSEVLTAPSRTFAQRGPTSHGKDFTLSADDFPTLVSKNPQSNSQRGRTSQGQPTFSSGSVVAQDEQKRSLMTGGDPVPTADFLREAQQAHLHDTQARNICMPPPWLDYWHPPPDHPPDRNGMRHRGVTSCGPCKPADTPDSFTVESFTHKGRSLLNQEGETRHGPIHGGYHTENRDSCYAYVPPDVCTLSLPHVIHGKVKDNHSDTLEKPVIKKDLVLLEKIRCLNIKARYLRAHNVYEKSSCRESNVEHPKSIDVKADKVTKDITPFSSITSDIAAVFDRVNSVSGSHNFVTADPSDVSANHVIVDSSEGHINESIEARNPGKYADYQIYGGGNTPRNSNGGYVKDTESNICGHGLEELSTVDSLPVMTNTLQDQSFPWNGSQQMHMRTADYMLNSPGYEIQHSRRELSVQHAKQTQEEERRKIQQKAKSIAEVVELNSSFVQSNRSNDALIEADKIHHKQNTGDSGTTKHDALTSDTSCMVYAENCNVPLTANVIKNTTDSISSTPAPDTAGVNRGHLIHNVMPSARKTDITMMEHTTKSVAQSHDTSAAKHFLLENRRRQVQSREGILREMSNNFLSTDNISESRNFVTIGPSNVPANCVTLDLSEEHVTEFSEAGKAGKSADYHVYGGENTSRNRHGSSAKNIASNICGQGWEEHSTVDSLPVMSNTHQDRSFPANRSQLVHVRADDDTLNSSNYQIQHSRSELSARHSKQLQEEYGGTVQQKAKSTAKLDDLCRLSFVRSQKSNDALIGADKTHCDKAGDSGTTKHDTSTSDACSIVYATIENGLKNTKVFTSSTPASDTAGVNGGPLIHNVMPSTNNLMEHIAQKSVSQSHETSAPKHLPMEDGQRQVHSREIILREKPNTAESTVCITDVAVAGTVMVTRSAEAKPHDKDSRPASPHSFCTENTEASSVHKTHRSGVVINSSIIPVQVASFGGFTVGSIMLGSVSLASVNQEEKTVVKEVHDTINSCASPQQTMQSGKNQYGVRHVKDPHGNGTITCAPVQEPNKKEQYEAGGLKCTAIPAPTQPSGIHSIVPDCVEPTKRCEMEKPAYREQKHLPNLRQMLPVEKQTASDDNSSTSKLETKRSDKEALDTSIATKAEVKSKPKNLEAKKTSRRLGRTRASRNKVSSNRPSSVVPNLAEEAANALLLNVMQELSEHGSRTCVGSEDRSQPTRAVLLPKNTGGKHLTSHNQRQYHIEGQENLSSNYASYIYSRGTVHGLYEGAALPTARILPEPISLPQNSALVNGVPGWTWDEGESTVISDMGNLLGFNPAAIGASGGELTQNVNWGSAMGLHGGQLVGDIAFQAAKPAILYHTGMELRELNPAWHHQGRHDGRHHFGSGTGVYLPVMDCDAGMQTRRANYMAGQSVGGAHLEYRLEPVASSGVAFGWSQGHPTAAWTAPNLEQGVLGLSAYQ